MHRHNYVFQHWVQLVDALLFHGWCALLSHSPVTLAKGWPPSASTPLFRKRPFFLTGLGEVWTAPGNEQGKPPWAAKATPSSPCSRGLRRWWLSTLPTCPPTHQPSS
ncbi:hypothetical protein QBC39DRAFT_359819 [Podospora conica]|nr:hypothetical protein QBC39DRAFT_359819 [Schizothecium conicum]